MADRATDMTIVDKIRFFVLGVVSEKAEQISADQDELMKSANGGSHHVELLFAPFLAVPQPA